MMSSIGVLLACSRLLCGWAPLPEPPVTDSDWSAMNPALPGVGPGGCSAILVHGSDVYVGGGFLMAGDVRANGIARWDGSRWHSVGSGGGGPTALAMDSSGTLYAGGSFTEIGGVSANRVAKWDGQTWSALGTGLDNEVYALAVDRAGNLYAGGYFQVAGGDSARRIARWDGSRWSSVGGGADSAVRALAFDASGNLFAGGDFSTAGGVASPHVARWNGTSWNAVGTGTDGPIHALTFSGGKLFAGGMFASAGGASASFVARWDGSSWSALGAGTNQPVEALTPRKNGGVYAAGQFTKAGTVEAVFVGAWDGTVWSSLNDTLSYSLAIATDSAGNVYDGGVFNSDGMPTLNIAKWDGTSWSAMGGGGFYGQVSALAGDTAGTVYFNSRTFDVSGITRHHVLKWSDGAVSGFPDLDGTVAALALGRDGSLYAGGNFGTTGSGLLGGVARWNGNAWSPLGSGMDAGVDCLLADSTGNLYAGGNFTTAGGVPANHIAKWDGKNWSVPGSGLDGRVHALVAGDSGGFFAAGDFQGVKKWDGRTWTSLGSLPGGVVALARDDSGALYAAVDFAPAGAQTYHNVIRWNGTSWDLLGKGFYNQVFALASDGNTIYAGGSFRATTTGLVNNMARWDGIGWTAVGSGTDGYVWALLISHGLVAGGDFATAGGVATPGLARLGVPFRHQRIELPAHRNKTYGDLPWAVPATSGLPVSVSSSNAAVASASGDSVSIRGTGFATFQAVQAGDKIWLPTAANETLSVAPKPIAVAGPKALDRDYDGTTAATVVFDSLSGVLPGDSVVLVAGKTNFSDPHVGTAKPVKDTGISLSGRSSANYALASLPVLSASIAPRPDTVRAVQASKPLGAPDPDLSYSASPLCSGDSRAGSLSRDPGDTAGTYSIRVGTLSDGPDYSMVFLTAPFLIQAPDALVTKPARQGTVRVPAIHPERVFAAPGRSTGPGDLAPRSGPVRDDQASVDILLPSPGTIRVSIFDHLGTPVIAWSGHLDQAGLRDLSSHGDGRRILPVSWNLRTPSGVAVSAGVYLWKIAVSCDDGQELESVEKLGVVVPR